MVLDKQAFFAKIGYSPHPGQFKMHENPARFRTLACGARWGKTTCSARELMFGMLKPDSRFWVVSETYDLANKVFREVLWTWLRVRPDFIEDYSESRMYIRTAIDSELFGKSANHPESLLGESLDGVAIDEPPIMRENIWTEFLMPRLMDRRGWAFFTGTPKGKGWYYHLFKRGLVPGQSDYYSQEGPSWENPIIDRVQLEREKSDGIWTERFWQQEVLGMFLEDSGAVFKNVLRHVAGGLQPPKPGEVYAIGADLAKHMDWTVITVMDKTGHIVDWERLPQGTSWPMQKIRIAEKSAKYNNAIVYIDSSGVGDPIVDDLRMMQVRLQPVPTAQEKTMLIDALVVAMDNDTITFPELPVLINELQIFEHEKTKTGRITYNAPAGFHDDAVISLALVWRGIGGMSSKAPAMLGWFEPRGPAFDFSQGRPI